MQQVDDRPDMRELQTMNTVKVVELTDTEALTALLADLRAKIKPGDDQELDEAVLLAIMKAQAFDLHEMLSAFRPIFLAEGKSAQEIKDLYRNLCFVSESKLQAFLEDFTRIRSQQTGLPVEAVIATIGFARPQGFWRSEDEPQRIYKLASICELLGEEA